MATPSCILAWKILWTEESGGLQSLGSQKSQKQFISANEELYKMAVLQLDPGSELSFYSLMKVCNFSLTLERTVKV